MIKCEMERVLALMIDELQHETLKVLGGWEIDLVGKDLK